MDNITILIDTREKQTHNNFLLKKWLSDNGILWREQKLTAGDYSFEIMGKSFEKEIVIERKSGKKLHGGGWTELKGNIMEKKTFDPLTGEMNTRLTREFNKLCINKTIVFLLIENAKGFKDIQNAKSHAKYFMISNDLFAFKFNKWLSEVNEKRFNNQLQPVEVVYCDSENTGKNILRIFNNYLR